MKKYEKVLYEWRWSFVSEKTAMEVADEFHNILRGNPDYIENRIILNVTGDTVTLTVWNNTFSFVYVNWEVDWEKPDAKWVLHVEEPVPFTLSHILEREGND